MRVRMLGFFASASSITSSTDGGSEPGRPLPACVGGSGSFVRIARRMDGPLLPVNGTVPGDALVGDRREREDVRARVERLEPLRLLGRHVVRRADGRAEDGELLRVLVLVLDRSEVEDLDVVALARAAEEQVVGLQIAVNELARVRFVEADGHLREHAHDALGRERLLALQDACAAPRRRGTP